MSTLITEEIKAEIGRRKGPIPFADFMRIALYHPEEGYYRRPRERVGFGGSTDFFTATSIGSVFGDLVVAACRRLLGPEKPEDFCFVEIGAEPGGGLLSGGHPFQGITLLRPTDPLRIADNSVLFSNELFDAQPFHRLVFTEEGWQEIGVDWRENAPREVLLPLFSPEVAEFADRLPKDSLEGYHLDLPLGANDLLDQILVASPGWKGLFIAFDYGKSWRELVEAVPHGTARAYQRHRQSNDLLADPGEQDLTCHICWDWLEERIRKHHFHDICLQSQEAFFVTHASDAIGAIISARPGEFDPRRQNLHQILHPGNMGQKFQVLYARR